MPATRRSEGRPALTLGVDGCPCGWVAVGARPAGGRDAGGRVDPERDTSWRLSWQVVPSLDALLSSEAGRAAIVVIDVPIGLSDGPKRACDVEARRLLRPGRAPTVFPPPLRQALVAGTQAEATRIGQAARRGGGVSAQTWSIVPKIREADAVVTPEAQGRLREGHPEIAFARMTGGPLAEGKKTRAGAAARRALLEGRGAPVGALLAELRAAYPKRAVADDDVVDAAVLALTGQDVLAGTAWRLGGGERDARGLRMEIWG